MMTHCCERNCATKVIARQLCFRHYMQKRRSGELKPLEKDANDIAYIAKRVDVNGDGCWIWKQGKTSGYGKIKRHGRGWQAHVFSFVAHFGKLPDGMQVNHKCHVRACCNPDHLYAGTQKQNMEDMRAAGRANYLRGTRSGMSKINDEIALEIFRSNGAARLFAEQFGVSISLVYAIRKRLIWRHIHAV